MGRDSDDDLKPSEEQDSFGSDLKTERFIELLDANDRQVFAYIYTLVANWDDAQEIMQRVRLRLWIQFDRYDEEKPFGAWARAVAYYLVLAFRKERYRQKEYFSEGVLESISNTIDEMEPILATRREVLLECLKKLNRNQRQLVETYYGRTKSVAEVASDYGVKPGALRQTLFRVRKLLRDCADRSLQKA